MQNKSLRVLELDKILQKMSGYTDNEAVKARVLDLKPATDLSEACLLQAQTSEAATLLYKYASPPNLNVGVVTHSVKRCEIGASLSPKELLDIARLLATARTMKKYLSQSNEADTPILWGMAQELEVIKPLEEQINLCILSEDEIADGASSELASIRRKMRGLKNKIKDILDDFIRSPKYQKYLQDPIITMRADRYVLPVRSEYRSDVSGIVHDTSRGGATLFIEPMSVVNANNDIRRLVSEEEAEIDRILAELSAFVSQHGQSILNNYHTICELDLFFCKGKLSVDQKASAPILNKEGRIDLKQARHPLIDPTIVVANDIYLGGDIDTLVITGPNTGGKTVTLKTLGLFCLMAAAGLHIPAGENSQVAVFDGVWADIGDEQSIEQSLSTFSSHMKNIVHITNHVGKNSLVLFDELGAGTDPVEGAALAVAILEYLRLSGAKTAATTHYSELKLFALSTDGVENASCEFDVQTLKPTYRLLIGVPGKSNAFAISKRLGLDENIILRAQDKMSEESVRFEDVIGDLEANRRITEAERKKAEALKQEIEELKEMIQGQKERLEANRQKLLDEAKREAKRILADAKQQTKELIKEVDHLRKNIQAQNIDKAVEDIRSKLRNKEKELDSGEGISKPTRSFVPPKSVIPGQSVEIVSLGQMAAVLTKPDKSGNLQVQAGIMKINVNLSGLRIVDDGAKPKVGAEKGSGQYTSRKVSAKIEIDLRGYALDDALYETDKFLDEAYLSGHSQVTVIHGKGTGVLRSGIQDMLKRHKHVKSFRLGQYGEGESGVTIVELK